METRPTWAAEFAFDEAVVAIGFAGGLRDPNTGLVLMGLRDNDPAVGHFASRDRALFAGLQTNLCLYAQGDPVNRVDRTGLASVEVGAGAGAYVGIKLAVDGTGFSFCWEGGVGIGAGIEVDPFEGTDPEGWKAVTEVALDVAGVGVSAKAERTLGTPCPQASGETKVCAGPACAKYNGDALGTNASLTELADVGAQAKITISYCTGSSW